MKAELGKAPKKPLEQLFAEHKEAQPIKGKRFMHKRDQLEYQVILTAHDVTTQELMVVFCRSALPALKFTREFKDFMENFEEIKG